MKLRGRQWRIIGPSRQGGLDGQRAFGSVAETDDGGVREKVWRRRAPPAPALIPYNAYSGKMTERGHPADFDSTQGIHVALVRVEFIGSPSRFDSPLRARTR
jgi:hypothetical protein